MVNNMFYNSPMYVDAVPNRKSNPTILLREGKRVGSKVIKKTIANITHWPPEQIEMLRLVLRNKKLVPAENAFAIERSLPHGHVQAVLGTIKKLGVDKLIAAKGSRQRDLVVAMIAERIIDPCSKLAATRLWHTTTLAEELKVSDADVNELYGALDWLVQRQPSIENRLARKHLGEGSLALYDLTNSSYYGRNCPLAVHGYNKENKKLPCIAYGLLTDSDGRPIAVDVYPGNTADPSTVPDQVKKIRGRFGLSRVVLVGDRGMLTQTQIATLRQYPGLGWITALKSNGIKKLMEEGVLQLSLFDKQNLAEISSPDYPGERLVACYNPLVAKKRQQTRQQLLLSTENKLVKIENQVNNRTRKPFTADDIGLKAGKVINRYKMAKHFKLLIKDGVFKWQRDEDSIKREEELDGIYVIRTSEKRESLTAEETVQSYKSLSRVERAFRCLKGLDILVRPIYHRTEVHVKGHIFLCLLAYYVEWHMRKLLAPLLFADEELDVGRKSDPVKKAEPSASAKKKKSTRLTSDQLTVHSFRTLLKELGTCCRNRCRAKAVKAPLIFYRNTELTPIQECAFELLGIKL